MIDAPSDTGSDEPSLQKHNRCIVRYHAYPLRMYIIETIMAPFRKNRLRRRAGGDGVWRWLLMMTVSRVSRGNSFIRHLLPGKGFTFPQYSCSYHNTLVTLKWLMVSPPCICNFWLWSKKNELYFYLLASCQFFEAAAGGCVLCPPPPRDFEDRRVCHESGVIIDVDDDRPSSVDIHHPRGKHHLSSATWTPKQPGGDVVEPGDDDWWLHVDLAKPHTAHDKKSSLFYHMMGQHAAQPVSLLTFLAHNNFRVGYYTIISVTSFEK